MTPKQKQKRRKQRGVALVTVLIAIAITLVLSNEFGTTTSTDPGGWLTFGTESSRCPAACGWSPSMPRRE